MSRPIVGIVVAVSVVFSAGATPAAAAEPSRSVIDVPRLDAIEIDGNPADWADRGFRASVLGDAERRVIPTTDFDAELRLGWNNDGLLVLATVRDDHIVEFPDVNELWRRDCIEMFLVADPNQRQILQYIVAPGVTEAHPDLRVAVYENKTGQPAPIESIQPTTHRSKIPGGYLIEAVMPWSYFSLQPKPGMEVGFQFYADDCDNPNGMYPDFYALLHPQTGTSGDPARVQRLRLAEQASAPILAAVHGEYQRMRRTRVTVAAVPEFVGKTVDLLEAGKPLESATLAARDGRAMAQIDLPMPRQNAAFALEARVDGVGFPISLPSPNEARAKAAMDARVRFDGYVFDSPAFPKHDLADANRMEDILGVYELKTTFYDKDYRVVTEAATPGRYGAVVEIHSTDMPVLRRFATLYRVAKWHPWWRAPSPATIQIPAEFGVDAAVVAEQSETIKRAVNVQFYRGSESDFVARLLAGLSEIKPGRGQLGPSEDAAAIERQWWVGLKRTIYGIDAKHPAGSFIAPRPIEGPPATVVHEGSLSEAGVKPEGPQRIDAVLQQWAAESGEPFSVCIVRRGVIVLHKAYGQQADGSPMTLGTRTEMASFTKMISASCLMMLVDQGLVSVEEPIDRYLPALAGIPAPGKPLTFRRCLNHTGGLWDHVPDDRNDLEESLASYYPHLDVGGKRTYQGYGFALAGKAIEMITGEAMPQFYQRHLLGPLGCTETNLTFTAYNTQSTALDMAKFGQMMLNKGAYGPHRFFSEKTFEQMLPSIEPGGDVGLGMVWVLPDRGLGKGAFTHGAASSATVRMDPQNDLVVVMMRNQAGKDFGKFDAQFTKTIVENLAE